MWCLSVYLGYIFVPTLRFATALGYFMCTARRTQCRSLTDRTFGPASLLIRWWVTYEPASSLGPQLCETTSHLISQPGCCSHYAVQQIYEMWWTNISNKIGTLKLCWQYHRDFVSYSIMIHKHTKSGTKRLNNSVCMGLLGTQTPSFWPWRQQPNLLHETLSVHEPTKFVSKEFNTLATTGLTYKYSLRIICHALTVKSQGRSRCLCCKLDASGFFDLQ